jgi:2-phospho-L-lactate guanylyltransferase
VRSKRSGRWRTLRVIVPIRGIARGKSRLAERLGPDERARLNRRLLEHTLRVIATWQGTASRCIVVSGCPQTLRMAARAKAMAFAEPRPGRGLNHAIGYAVRRAVRSGARAILVLPSDLPRLSVAALDALVRRAPYGYTGAIAPDGARTGTNALLLKTRARFEFSFGPDSFPRHLQAARLRGWRLAICTHPDLALDVDLPADLAAWRAAGESSRRRMV